MELASTLPNKIPSAAIAGPALPPLRDFFFKRHPLGIDVSVWQCGIHVPVPSFLHMSWYNL